MGHVKRSELPRQMESLVTLVKIPFQGDIKYRSEVLLWMHYFHCFIVYLDRPISVPLSPQINYSLFSLVADVSIMSVCHGSAGRLCSECTSLSVGPLLYLSLRTKHGRHFSGFSSGILVFAVVHGLAARSPELQGLGRSDRQLCYKAACDQRDETTYHRFFVCRSWLLLGFVCLFVLFLENLLCLSTSCLEKATRHNDLQVFLYRTSHLKKKKKKEQVMILTFCVCFDLSKVRSGSETDWIDNPKQKHTKLFSRDQSRVFFPHNNTIYN